jgi:hypothetical protein
LPALLDRAHLRQGLAGPPRPRPGSPSIGYIGGPLARAKQAVDIYRHAGERAGHPDRLRVGISTHSYAGADLATARDVFPYYHEYLRPKTPGGRGFTSTGPHSKPEPAPAKPS